MTKHTVDSLAAALYEGLSTLTNLAENMAKQYGKVKALSFFGLMGDNVQFFWKDIARQIIEHSKEWEKTEEGFSVLSKKEENKLQQLMQQRRQGERKIS